MDYKTGRLRDPGVLDGGELQRCLYAYVVQALLGQQVTVEAALLYPSGDGAYRPLQDTKAALTTLTTALLRAEASLRGGNALFGPDTGGGYDNLAFALPASPGALTERKRAEAAARLGDAALICLRRNGEFDFASSEGPELVPGVGDRLLVLTDSGALADAAPTVIADTERAWL